MIFRILHHRTKYHKNYVEYLGSDELTLPSGQKSVKTYTNAKFVNTNTGEECPDEFVVYEFDEPEEFANDFIRGWEAYGKCSIKDGIPVLYPAFL